MRSVLLLCSALVLGCGGAEPPIQGVKRGELCERVQAPPPFRCPAGASQRGKPPPDGTEMWCQRKDGTRHGPYRRFPPGAVVEEPALIGEGVVVGEYAEDRQHGAWYTRRAGSDVVAVRYFEKGEVVQRIDCRP